MNLARIYKALEADPELTKRIKPLQSAGLNIDELGGYLNNNPEKEPQILSYIRDGLSARELSLENLTDIEQLTFMAKHLDSTINPVEYLIGLQRKGLVGMKLAEYVRERPEQRHALVEQLIKENADVRRFNEQMRLVAFPDKVAFKLADLSRTDGMKETKSSSTCEIGKRVATSEIWRSSTPTPTCR